MAQRITSLHVDVLRVNRNIDTLIAQHYPDVAAAIEQRLEQELCSVRIPDPLLGRLGGMFDRHKLGRPPTLHEMADCFLIQFEKSTVILPISVDDDRQSPPVDQYLALLKCQLVMDRMKDTNELRNPRRMSHWPGYVRALEEVGFSRMPVFACAHQVRRNYLSSLRGSRLNLRHPTCQIAKTKGSRYGTQTISLPRHPIRQSVHSILMSSKC